MKTITGERDGGKASGGAAMLGVWTHDGENVSERDVPIVPLCELPEAPGDDRRVPRIDERGACSGGLNLARDLEDAHRIIDHQALEIAALKRALAIKEDHWTDWRACAMQLLRLSRTDSQGWKNFGEMLSAAISVYDKMARGI